MIWRWSELSIGEKCEHQPIGATFYESVGPALEAFEAIAPIVFKSIEKSKSDLEKGIPALPPAEIRLFMVSKFKIPFVSKSTVSETTIKRQARPTIVIISASRLYRKRVIALLRKDKQLEKHPEFEFAGFAKDPAKPMALSGSFVFEYKCGGIYVEKSSAVEPGVSLIFSTGKRATLGEVIRIDGHEYGVTVFHACDEAGPIEADIAIILDEPEDDDDLEFDDYEFDQNDGGTLPYKSLSENHEDLIQERPSAEADYKGPALRKIGTVSTGHFSRELDYLIFRVDASSGRPVSVGTRTLQQMSAVPRQHQVAERDAWALTGTNGYICGSVLSRKHFMKLPGNSSFEELWAVRLGRKALPGDCGASVLDRATNQLYGHIVAGDPDSCLAFIVPAYKVLRDIGIWSGNGTRTSGSPRPQGLFVSPGNEIQYQRTEKSAPELLYCNRDRSKQYHSAKTEVYITLDSQPFNWKILLVAATGFFPDAYNLFAANVILPLLAYVYLDGEMTKRLQNVLTVSLLAGMIIGQLCFGILADMLGRRRMYGLEHVITILAVLGISMTTADYEGSMGVLGWLSLWRFLLGIGIGADYPLSAVITAEWAPLKTRSRVLVGLFYMRLISPFVGLLSVGLVIAAFDRHIEPICWGSKFRTAENMSTIDSIWRLVVGLGAVPALVGIYSRLVVPETPRYTADVLQRPNPTGPSFDRMLLPSEMNVRQRASESTTHRLETAFGANSSFKAQVTDFIDFIFNQGHWQPLLVTSLCWFFLDFSFYGLGYNSPAIVSRIWQDDETTPTSIYSILMKTSIKNLIIVILSSALGSIFFLTMLPIWRRRRIQLQTFAGLLVLFVLLGSHWYIARWHFEGILLLYLFSLSLFNFGPNVVTFILPAEIFPTRFRATCHGITAASGTLGCIFAQVFFSSAKFDGKLLNDHDINSKYFTFMLLILSVFMTLGTVVTWFWIPETCDTSGKSKSLEELAATFQMSREESRRRGRGIYHGRFPLMRWWA